VKMTGRRYSLKSGLALRQGASRRSMLVVKEVSSVNRQKTPLSTRQILVLEVCTFVVKEVESLSPQQLDLLKAIINAQKGLNLVPLTLQLTIPSVRKT